MATRMLLSLTLAFLFVAGARSITVTFTNKCPYTVWPATLRGDQLPQLSTTGFELTTGASKPVTVNAPWSGRFWGRTGCTTDASGQFRCATADCASRQVTCNGAGGIPPASLIEFTLAENGGQDNYDISLVDGFNVPLAVAPQGGTGNCPALACAGNVNDVCPRELAVPGSDGRAIACKSACEALGKPEYCCTGAHSTPETCPPTNYSKIFKDKCPQAYSYAYDDKSSLFTCSNGPNYLVTFCP